jgi:hypothetical protein
MNRREAIATAVGLAVSAVVPVTGNETADLCREHPAQFACEWELMAIQHNCPNRWRTFRYVTGCQWDKASFILYGIGPPEVIEAEFTRYAAQWEKHGPIDRHITPDGRAWALHIEGRLSNRLREELRTLAPSLSGMQTHDPHDGGWDPFEDEC